MNSLEFTRFPQLDYAGAEALNTLCTNLSFAGEDVHRIMLTSCQSAEGKSYITMNMMRTFAGLGKRVVLVDADLRRSMIASRYGMQMYSDTNGQGLTHYLAGMCNMEDIVYSTNIPGAFMVPVGRDVSNSLALLTTNRLPALLDMLADNFDFVLVDAPPVGVIIDAAEISKYCDGTLLVISYNKIRRRDVLQAKHQIERAGCRVLGAVLNNVSFDSYSSKKYYNKAYYNSYYVSNYYNPDNSHSSIDGDDE